MSEIMGSLYCSYKKIVSDFSCVETLQIETGTKKLILICILN